MVILPLLLGACPGRQAPKVWAVAQAASAKPAAVLELRFSPGETGLSPHQQRRLEAFVSASRLLSVDRFEVVSWAFAGEESGRFAVERNREISAFLQRQQPGTAIEIVQFGEREHSPPASAVIAVMKGQ